MATGTHIFVSYSRLDVDFALRLVKDLRSAGVDIWLDKLDIPPGVHWDRAVDHALRTCDRLLIILSPNAEGSENVQDEIAVALDAGRPVVPVLYRPCKVPLRLMRLQYIDFSVNYQDGLTTLLAFFGGEGSADYATKLSGTKALSSSSNKPSTGGEMLDSRTSMPSTKSFVLRQRSMLITGLVLAVVLLAIFLIKGFLSQQKSQDLQGIPESRVVTKKATTTKVEPEIIESSSMPSTDRDHSSVTVTNEINQQSVHEPDAAAKKEATENVGKVMESIAEPSTDRDHPTALITNEIKGLGFGKPVSHYYSFMADPGELRVTLDVNGGKVEVRLYDSDWKELIEVSEYAPGPGGGKRKVEHLQLPRRQRLVMEVAQVILFGDVVKSYMVRLETTTNEINQQSVHEPDAAAKKEATKIVGKVMEATAEPSTDRDHPTTLITNEIKGVGFGKPVSHYYSFMADPGELRVTLDVNGGKVEVRLYDSDWKELIEVSEYAPGPGGGKRKVEHLQLPRRQRLVMEVAQVILFGDVVKSYMVRLEAK